MGTAPTANSSANSLGGNDTSVGEQSMLPQREPKQSAIRDLAGSDAERTAMTSGFSHQFTREAMAPPPFTLDAAAEHYCRLASGSPDVMHALQAGDLPNAIVTLIQENFLLRKQNASWQSDFDELRSVNIAQQEQADARLAIADEERLELLDQLERARTELIEVEGQCEQARRDYEDDLDALRQQRDALQQEVFDLRARVDTGN
jgi:ABC-type amino acid transport substrate-binding protein